ncbi:MAG: DUF167 domain-containing protein [Opitutales bacterium]|nr:DUF167 domain-containing protein [Opitutales bacterium]
MSDASFLLRVRAVPNAKKTQFTGTLGDAVKIKVQAVPEGGRANAELSAFLAESLALPKRSVSVVSGETSRDKILKIEGCSRERAEEVWGFVLPKTLRG